MTNDQHDEPIFLWSVFSLEKTVFCLFVFSFIHYEYFSSDASDENTSWITSTFLMVCWVELDCILHHRQQNQNVYAYFLMIHAFSSTIVFILLSHFANKNSPSEHSFFSFSSDIFTYEIEFFLFWPFVLQNTCKNFLWSSPFFDKIALIDCRSANLLKRNIHQGGFPEIHRNFQPFFRKV